MSCKVVPFDSQPRESILRGPTALTDAVRITLGPKSKYLLLQRKWGQPLICNDVITITIANAFQLQDPVENLGSQMRRQAAERTGEAVGDGTTTSTANAIDLKRGLKRGSQAAITALRLLSRAVPNRQEKVKVAAIPAHNLRQGIGNYGFDAAQSRYLDPVEVRIIEPTKVVRRALESTVSIAATLLLTEATLTDTPEPKAATSPAPAPPML